MKPCVRKTEGKGYNFIGRAWVEGNEGVFLDFDRIDLLERIKIDGSINKAAKSLKMSYVQAWKLSHAMNSRAKSPLVTIERGGIKGGGVRLTDDGEKVVEFFRDFQGRFKTFLEQEIKDFPL